MSRVEEKYLYFLEFIDELRSVLNVVDVQPSTESIPDSLLLFAFVPSLALLHEHFYTKSYKIITKGKTRKMVSEESYLLFLDIF